MKKNDNSEFVEERRNGTDIKSRFQRVNNETYTEIFFKTCVFESVIYSVAVHSALKESIIPNIHDRLTKLDITSQLASYSVSFTAGYIKCLASKTLVKIVEDYSPFTDKLIYQVIEPSFSGVLDGVKYLYLFGANKHNFLWGWSTSSVGGFLSEKTGISFLSEVVTLVCFTFTSFPKLDKDVNDLQFILGKTLTSLLIGGVVTLASLVHSRIQDLFDYELFDLRSTEDDVTQSISLNSTSHSEL
jgi:hypothetical protein